MPEARLYRKEDLLSDLGAVGNRLPRKIKVYLIGGCAMSLKDLKEFTKDVDAIFVSISDLKLFEKELLSLGYEKSVSLDVAYEKLGAYSILRHPENAGFDLFDRKVCNMLTLSDGMVHRSSKYGDFGRLELFLLSNEDIALFKGITERPRDIDDIAAIIKSTAAEGRTFDWDAIRSECMVQAEHLKIEGHLYDRFHELFTRYQIRAPLLSWLRKRGIRNLLYESYRIRLEKGMSHENIMREFEGGGFNKSDIKILRGFKKK
ncbi:hypothetical protein H0O00_05490 [Candidatus Micrarchaeota archaeon]|nr:hypothetical protein [Candidatus Micrarchaeota archaeon]